MIARRIKRRLPEITKGLNVIAAALVVMNLAPILTHGSALAGADEPEIGRDALGTQSLDPGTAASQPDIYYLIFDRYADDEIMRERFDYDNSSFTRWLEKRGFRVPKQSTLNYHRTGHSLASSLNMRYLDGLARKADGSATIDAVYRELNDFRVASLLKSLGYRYAHMGSRWPPTSENPVADHQYRFEALTEFATTFYETTVVAPIADRLGLLESFDPRRAEWARRRWQFETLMRIGDQPGPKFVFGHLLTPHPPYVNDRDGRFVSEERAANWSYERKYVEQVIYTNEEIKKLIDHLLDVPKAEQPIIILQADEGPHPNSMEDFPTKVFDWTTVTPSELEMKFKLFTALHLPGIPESEVRRDIYPTFTPVNTFRVIFNLYHGGDFRLLPDKNFIYRDYNHPLDLIEVTDRLGIVEDSSQRTAARTSSR